MKVKRMTVCSGMAVLAILAARSISAGGEKGRWRTTPNVVTLEGTSSGRFQGVGSDGVVVQGKLLILDGTGGDFVIKSAPQGGLTISTDSQSGQLVIEKGKGDSLRVSGKLNREEKSNR